MDTPPPQISDDIIADIFKTLFATNPDSEVLTQMTKWEFLKSFKDSEPTES